jgi:hypothetical protein
MVRSSSALEPGLSPFALFDFVGEPAFVEAPACLPAPDLDVPTLPVFLVFFIFVVFFAGFLDFALLLAFPEDVEAVFFAGLLGDLLLLDLLFEALFLCFKALSPSQPIITRSTG